MGRRKYVLIVDDCQQDRMAVADVLRSDYDILEACNGKQALEILSRKRAQISLIMLDLMMPVMDGYEFLRCIGSGRSTAIFRLWCVRQKTTLRESRRVWSSVHGILF